MGAKRPEPAATSVTAASAAVPSTEPVPPPLTKRSGGSAATTAARRVASSRADARCMARSATPRSGFAGRSPTPAICASYIISPSSSSPRAVISRASAAACSGVRSGERLAPIADAPVERPPAGVDVQADAA